LAATSDRCARLQAIPSVIMINAFILLLFPMLMAFAASSDLLTMTISNKLVLALIAGFLALALLTGLSASVIGSHLGSGALVLVVAFGCYAAGWIGGGDAKLAAAIALWFGFDQVVTYLLYASLLGGVLTLLVLRFRSEPLPAVLARQGWVMRLHNENAGVPYGIALAAAALIVYPDTIIMQQLIA
jgi:prepilin peptidase CpaA